jgi:SagB-type dehydrogenase family enzyme
MAEIFRREAALSGNHRRYAEAPLSELFHENTKMLRPAVDAIADAGSYGVREMEAMARAYKRYRARPQTPLVPLPASIAARSMADIVMARRTNRNFSPEPLGLADVSAILQWSFGVTGEMTIPGGARQQFRATPSAGALYPTELYLAVRTVTGLEPGIYHYEVPSASLALLNRGDPTGRLYEACCRQSFACEAGVVVLMSAVLERTKRKYHERGYRYALIETGHVAQNLYLACTALGLAVVTSGAFFDDEAADLLEIDGCDEAVIYVAFVGKSGEGKRE